MDPQEKLEWLGRQILLVKSGKKDDAESNARQVAPFFDHPHEREIIKFFIKDGGSSGSSSSPSGGSGSEAECGTGEGGEGDQETSDRMTESGKSSAKLSGYRFIRLDCSEKNVEKVAGVIRDIAPLEQVSRWEALFGSVEMKLVQIAGAYGKVFWAGVRGDPLKRADEIVFLSDKLKEELS